MQYRDLNEKKKHGSENFPIQYYSVTAEHPHYRMPLHWHKEFELVRVSSGTLHLFLNNVEYILKSGDLAFISSGMLHRGEPEDSVYECLVFDLNMLRRYSGDLISRLILPIANGDAVVECCAAAMPEKNFSKTVLALLEVMREKPPLYELTVYSLLFRLFADLYAENAVRTVTGKKRKSRRTDTMISVISWIDLHFREPITLSGLAGISGMNEKYLCHLFKEFTDRTPIDYINNLRIDYACQAIQSGCFSITEVAYESGFNDLSYFSRSFRKYKGCSPSEYQKKHVNSQSKCNSSKR